MPVIRIPDEEPGEKPLQEWSMQFSVYHGAYTILDSGRNYVATVQIHQTPRHMGAYDEDRRSADASLLLQAPRLLFELKQMLGLWKANHKTNLMEEATAEEAIRLAEDRK